ncbi:MAG: FAD-binding oxidoreductase, partial [Methanobacteriota archaeon]
MGLLRDWHYIEKAVEIPALSEVIRESLIRALFVRDDRLLPKDLIADLNRLPPVTVKVKDDSEVRKLVRVLNGEESTVSLGLSAEDYHFFRTQLGVGRTREFGVVVRPRTLLTYDWIVPEQRGVQLDFTAYAEIEFSEEAHRAIAQVGATWKQLYDAAPAKGHRVPFVPTVPLDFAVGDGVYGDAPFGAYRGEFGAYVNALRTISPFGHRARVGFEEVANNGTAYDLLHATLPLAGEFFLPVALALRLEAKPTARKTLTYTFDDGAKLSVALDKLTRSSTSPDWVHVTDAVAARTLRPSVAAEAFTAQISMSGTGTGLPAKEKALDTAMAGFKAKSPDVPNP